MACGGLAKLFRIPACLATYFETVPITLMSLLSFEDPRFYDIIKPRIANAGKEEIWK